LHADKRPSDTDLLRRARTGDEAAFTALVHRWYPQVHRWAVGQTDDRDAAEDVAQQVLIRLHLHLDRFRGDAKLSTWLFQVTRNAARDAFRKRRRRERMMERVVSADPTVPADPTDEVERREMMGLARQALARLPERQRTVFDLVDLQGYAAAEAANLLGLSPGTVRAHLFRARRAVRAAVLHLAPELAAEKP
jgi:RNA polymerase sigma factor (sigma-70 family)